MKNNAFLRILLVLGLYLGLRYFGGEVGRDALYPVTLLVTFLHEFGHALGALITGGAVNRVQINADGSGFTETVGGSRAIVLMGGYLGSAILGNILFYVGAKSDRVANVVLYLLAALMLFTGFYWFNTMFTTGVLVAFAVAMMFIAAMTSLGNELLMFLGLATTIYIIQDFNVGPGSDLARYAELFVVIPQNAWMYIWLAIVVLLTFVNLRVMFRHHVGDRLAGRNDDPDRAILP